MFFLRNLFRFLLTSGYFLEMIIGCFTFYTCFQDAAQLSGFFLIDFAFA